MEHAIVTISREYGSGGSRIGQLAGEILGIPCYGRNQIDQLAHRRGLDREYISQWQEHASDPFIWGVRELPPQGQGWLPKRQPAYYTNEEKMIQIQSRLIQELAQGGSCVFVGRCAGYVLRDHPRCLRVRVVSGENSRGLRIYNEYQERTGSLAAKMWTVDQGRAAYYRRVTGQLWDDVRNYHLVLDSGELSLEGCAQMIVSAVQILSAERYSRSSE